MGRGNKEANNVEDSGREKEEKGREIAVGFWGRNLKRICGSFAVCAEMKFLLGFLLRRMSTETLVLRLF